MKSINKSKLKQLMIFLFLTKFVTLQINSNRDSPLIIKRQLHYKMQNHSILPLSKRSMQNRQRISWDDKSTVVRINNNYSRRRCHPLHRSIRRLQTDRYMTRHIEFQVFHQLDQKEQRLSKFNTGKNNKILISVPKNKGVPLMQRKNHHILQNQQREHSLTTWMTLQK